ncbi:MAG: 50S ribosomal protein L17 [Thermodesulfobacteriota bacterium]|nr:50S ribosomal protein L17 [Thermodesulfobacteriota bacterium]
MRHQKAIKKLGRTSSHRKAMMRNLVASLLKHEKIETTEAKAKELRSLAEKIITLGKRDSLHARRQILKVIPDKKTTKKIMEEIAPRYKLRNSGFIRIIKFRHRKGDNAKISIVELLPDIDFEKTRKRRFPKRESQEVKSEKTISNEKIEDDVVKDEKENQSQSAI